MTPTPIPTGRILPTDAGHDLVLTRRFDTDIDDLWASITESDRTARWFASWTGDAGPGETIRYRLSFEDGAPEGEMRIEICDPPHHLAVTTADDAGAWHLDARLVESDGITELTFTQHLTPDAPIGEVGPGWEYYLDLLVASRDGTPLPDFDDYYPAQRAYFLALLE